MATTSYGTPYVEAADLVSGYPSASLSLANRVDDVSLKANGINARTASYTLVLGDGGKNITMTVASANTLTVPTNSVAFPTGVLIGVANLGAGACTITPASTVTVNGSSLVLAQYETGVLLKTDTNTWLFSKGGGLPKASYSSTTGSPTITTVSGKTCINYTGSGSIVIDTAGLVECLVVGGGGGGNSGSGGLQYGGGGGAGGYVYSTSFYLTAGTYTVTVGSGGAGGGNATRNGNTSAIALAGAPSIVSPGGGAGGSNPYYTAVGLPGASGGGGGAGASYAGGAGVTGIGNAGGAGAPGTGGYGGGGGGSAGAGGAGGNSTVGTGGAGTSNSITGSAVTYAAGGAGDGGATGGANTGNGGGGGNAGGAGGSGRVILLIG